MPTAANDKSKDITFHYTNPLMVRYLVKLIPMINTDSVLDAGSGKNKIWFNTVVNTEKYECEIENGADFFEWEKKVDWIIGNPPFDEGWRFLDRATQIAIKGVAFLGNLNFWNCCLPKRLELLRNRGFYLNKLHIVQDRRWFGRYYFLIFTKEVNNFIGWNTKSF